MNNTGWMADLELEQEIYKIILKHLIVSENKEVLKNSN